jgi:hypothetical protein
MSSVSGGDWCSVLDGSVAFQDLKLLRTWLRTPLGPRALGHQLSSFEAG